MLRWLLVYAFLLMVPSSAIAAPTSTFTDQFFRLQPLHQSTSALFFSNLDPQAPPIQTAVTRGSWLIINVWATWCAPCLAELPHLDTLAAAAPANVVFWAVSVDQTLSAGQIAATRRRLNLQHLPLYHDRAQTLGKMVNTRSLPVTLIIDPNGHARLALYGAADWGSATAQDFIANLQDLFPPPKARYTVTP
jgi:thiol-disulfide isomerase/thioredoxin